MHSRLCNADALADFGEVDTTKNRVVGQMLIALSMLNPTAHEWRQAPRAALTVHSLIARNEETHNKCGEGAEHFGEPLRAAAS